MLTSWLEGSAQAQLLSSWSESIGLDLLHLGTSADAEEIKDTANAQPLIVAAGLLSANALNLAGKFSYVAGHSVG
jgi:[acyl-carrier-protein] S-malonyltransferase